MQVHQTPQNKSPKVIASLAQRLALAEKKIEQLQSNTSFANPMAFVGGIESPNSTLVGSSSLAAVDSTGFTNTSNTFSQLTKAWTIPANDAVPGTAYRLTAYGQGAEGTTPTTLSIVLASFGGAQATTGLASGTGTNTTFAWKVTGTLVIVSPTAAHFETDGSATFGNPTGGRAGSSVSFNANSLSVSISPASATTLMFQSAFGTPGTGTTITCNLSIFERL